MIFSSYEGDILKKIIFISIILFCFIAYLVMNNKTDNFDSFIYDLIYFKSDFLTMMYKFITEFASIFIILIISLISLFIFKKYGIFLIINAFNILILNTILKLIFMRDRPFDLMIINEDGYSFPSGHAMAALGFYGFIIYIIYHLNLSKRIKYLFIVLLSILIILIGLSRIYLGVHYASDVIAGYLASLAYLIIYITIIKKYLKFGEVK